MPGLSVADTAIAHLGSTKVLVVTRFNRR